MKTSARASRRLQQRGVLGFLDVGDEALLAAVEPDEVARQAIGGTIVAAGEVALGALDLDDAGAGVGEAGTAVGRGDRLFERDDEQAVERAHQCEPISVRPHLSKTPSQ